MHDADSPGTAVDRFVTTHPTENLSPHRARLEAMVKEQAIWHRLTPALSVPVAREPGKPPAFTVDIYRGDSAEARARIAAEAARLEPEEVDKVAALVLTQAKAAGVEPVLVVPFRAPVNEQSKDYGSVSTPREPTDTSTRPVLHLVLLEGDDIPTVAQRFVEEEGLPPSILPQVQKTTVEVARKKGVAPLFSVPFRVRPSDAAGNQEADQPVIVDVYVGQSVEETVEEARTTFDLTPPAVALLRMELEREARVAGVMPMLVVDVQEILRDLKAEMTPPTSTNTEETTKVALAAVVDELASFPGWTDVGDLELYVGQSVEEACAQHGERYHMPPHLAQAVAEHVRATAQLRRLVPVLTVPVSATIATTTTGVRSDDNQDQDQDVDRTPTSVLPVVDLPVYHGDTEMIAVARFFDQLGVSLPSIPTVQLRKVRDLVSRAMIPAQAAGDLPLLTVPVQVGSRPYRLPVYAGEDGYDAVDRLLKVAKLDPATIPPSQREAAAEEVTRAAIDANVHPAIEISWRKTTISPTSENDGGKDDDHDDHTSSRLVFRVMKSEVEDLPGMDGQRRLEKRVRAFAAEHSLDAATERELTDVVLTEARRKSLIPLLNEDIMLPGGIGSALLTLRAGDDIRVAVHDLLSRHHPEYDGTNPAQDPTSVALLGDTVRHVEEKARAARVLPEVEVAAKVGGVRVPDLRIYRGEEDEIESKVGAFVARYGMDEAEAKRVKEAVADQLAGRAVVGYVEVKVVKRKGWFRKGEEKTHAFAVRENLAAEEVEAAVAAWAEAEGIRGQMDVTETVERARAVLRRAVGWKRG